jgi:hypothetical protein
MVEQQRSSRLGRARLLRLALLPSWWLLFAVLTFRAGKEPGFVMHPEQTPYPWRAVVLVCLLLAVEVVGLHWIVRPDSERPWRRLGLATALFGALSLVSLLTLVTDMPGYYYVPGNFHILTFAGLITTVAARSVARRWRRTAARHRCGRSLTNAEADKGFIDL